MVTTRQQNIMLASGKMEKSTALAKKANIPGTQTLNFQSSKVSKFQRKKPILRYGKASIQHLKITPKSPVTERRGKVSNAPNLGTHILFLFVGAQRELITIHSDLLPDTTKSYIGERNAGGQLFQLPNEDAAIFQIYRLFLYTGKVYSLTQNDQDVPDNGTRTAQLDSQWTRLAHCYLFAMAVKDERFANASIDAVIEKMTVTDRYPTGIAHEAYANTAAGDKLRDLIVDVHVWKGRGTWVKPPHDDANAPVEFLQNVIEGLANAGGNIHAEEVVMPWEEKPCTYYHLHQLTERCRVFRP